MWVSWAPVAVVGPPCPGWYGLYPLQPSPLACHQMLWLQIERDHCRRPGKQHQPWSLKPFSWPPTGLIQLPNTIRAFLCETESQSSCCSYEMLISKQNLNWNDLSITDMSLPSKGSLFEGNLYMELFHAWESTDGLEILNVVGPSQADVIEIVDQLLEDSVVASVGNRKHGLFEAIKLRKKRPLQSTTCPQSTCTNRIVTWQNQFCTCTVWLLNSLQFPGLHAGFHTIVHTPTSISHKFLILQSTWPGSHPCNIPRSIQVMTMTCFGGIAVTLLMTSPGPKSCPAKI